MISSVNPRTEQVVEVHECDSQAEQDKKLQASLTAQKAWRGLSAAYRVKRIHKLKDSLTRHEAALAELIHVEMGKSIIEAFAEIQKAKSLVDYVASAGEIVLKDQELDVPGSYLSWQPLGIILGIMPWNFPVWQALRFALPCLASGNSVLIKPAESVFGVAKKLQLVFEEADLGSGLVSTVYITKQETESLIKNIQISGVSLTGSVGAGRSVGELCGRHLKKSVLELGGSDPYIILKDADVALAVREVIAGRFVNSGQSCVAAKRIIVVQDIYEIFVEELLRKVNEIEINPMARRDLVTQLNMQVEHSIQMGAKVVYQGKTPTTGFYYPVTVLQNVIPGMKVFDEEVFGPVLPIIRARDSVDAIELANQSEFALGAAIFSQDQRFAEDVLVKQLQCGMGFVNSSVKSHPAMPFGGMKSSGLGRELGTLGFLEFCNPKTIVVPNR